MPSEEEFLEATLPALGVVHNLARRFVHDRADAEDLVQETYLRAWKAWAEGRPPRRVAPWLARICLNLGDWCFSPLRGQPTTHSTSYLQLSASAVRRSKWPKPERHQPPRSGLGTLARPRPDAEPCGQPGHEPLADVDVEADAIGRVQRSQVERALRALPEEQRVTITLMDLGGFTAAETAQLTGSRRGTVLARVHRGRKALARLVEEEARCHAP